MSGRRERGTEGGGRREGGREGRAWTVVFRRMCLGLDMDVDGCRWMDECVWMWMDGCKYGCGWMDVSMDVDGWMDINMDVFGCIYYKTND